MLSERVPFVKLIPAWSELGMIPINDGLFKPSWWSMTTFYILSIENNWIDAGRDGFQSCDLEVVFHH